MVLPLPVCQGAAARSKVDDQFPEYADIACQPLRDRITIAHALSMTLGTEWEELTIPYGDQRNSATATQC
jgi:hypothetical protein